MAEKRFEIGDAVRFGWETAKANIGFFIVVVLVLWVVQGIFNWPSYVRIDPYYVWMPLFSVLNWVVSTFVGLAIIRISLRFNKGETAEFEDLWMGYPKFLEFFVGSILYGLLVMVGFILLIVPGVYWAVKYQFFGYCIMDRDVGPWEALKMSGNMTKGSWWNLFWLGLVQALIAIAGACACCIGLFWAMPTAMVAHGYAYMRLAYAGPPQAMPVTAAPAPGAYPAPEGPQAPLPPETPPAPPAET